MTLLQDFDGTNLGAQGVGCRPGFGISMGTAVEFNTWNRFFDPGFFLDANNGTYSVGFVDRDGNQWVSSGVVTSGAVQDLSEGDMFSKYLGFFGNSQGPGFYSALPVKSLTVNDVIISSSIHAGVGPYQFGSAGVGPLAQIWGGDFCQSQVGTFVTDGTSSQSITGVGFSPDVLLLIGTVGPGADTLHLASPVACIGGCDATLAQWGMCARSVVGTGNIVFGAHCGYYVRASRWSNTSVVAVPDTPSCAQNGFSWEDPQQSVTGSITSMDADGFTIGWPEPYSVTSPGLTFSYLALKGIPRGAGLPPHSRFSTGWARTGDTAVTTGFKPTGMVLAGLGQSSSDACIGMGVTDGTKQRAFFSGGVSGTGFGSGRDPSSYATDNAVYVLGDPEGETVEVQAEFVSFNDHDVTLNWSSDDGNRRPFGWMAWTSECIPHGMHVTAP